MTLSPAAHHWARLATGLLLLVAAHLLLRGYVTDDTYIHLRYAENLVERGEFSFNPGDATYGATSPLWIFGLALLLKFGLAGPAAAWTLGLLSGALTVWVLAGLLRRMGYPQSWRWWLLLLAVVDAWFLRWTMSGMETPLATAILLVLLWPLVIASPVERPDQRLWPRYLAWGTAAGLAALVRPEYLLLAPAALPVLLLFEYRRADATRGRAGRVRARPHGPVLAAGCGWLLTAGPWLAYAHATFGRVTPGTAEAKSYDATFAFQEIAASLMRSLQQLGMTQAILWAFFLALVLFVLVERVRQERSGEYEEPPPVPTAWQFWRGVTVVLVTALWVALLLGGYAVNRVWTISRYLSPLSPPMLMALAVLAYWLLNLASDYRGRPFWSRWAPAVACALSLTANVAITTLMVRPHVRDFSAGVVECYLERGEWLGENSPPGAVIAALDIGALAYGSDLPVRDLMGLVSPEIMAMGREMGFEAMVESGIWLRGLDGEAPPPTWFVDRSLGPPRWDGRTVRGVTFELVDTCTIRGVGLREPEDWTVATYRLRPRSSGS
jgi:hypothetical protein